MARAGTACLRVDEVNVIDFMAHPVPDEAQACQGPLGQLALCGSLACQHGVVGIWVMAYQRGVDNGDPPHRLTDPRERSRPVRRPDPGSRSVVSLIAVRDHRSALTPAAGSPVFSRFHATRQRAEQNRACSRRGANEPPHCSQFRISANGSCYA